MTTTVLSLFLCLVLCATYSFTIPLDVKTVDLSKSVFKYEEESTPAMLNPHPSPSEDKKLVLSLTSVDAYPSLDSKSERSRRDKREVMTTRVKCAEDMVELAGRCVTKEQYKTLTDGDEEE